MNTQQLLHALTTVPGTPGQHITRRMAVNMIATGRAEAGGVLVDMVGLAAIPALAAAGAPAPALRIAIETALLEYYKELPPFIAANGGRPAFAKWCRQAAFTLPSELPEMVDLYRGTMGVSPEIAAAGLHWSNAFGKAAFFACRFADAHLTGVIVLHARVPRDSLVAAVAGLEEHGEHELVLADVPTSFEVITDHALILHEAFQAMRRYQALAEQGYKFTETRGHAERAAAATRARMAAAGVAPGTAIVA